MSAEHFEEYLSDGSHRGPVPDGAFSGAAGGSACGDVCRISLGIEDGAVTQVTHETEGCGAMAAAAAAASDLVDGEAVLDAARVGSAEIDAALGGLLAAKLHAPQLVA